MGTATPPSGGWFCSENGGGARTLLVDADTEIEVVGDFRLFWPAFVALDEPADPVA